MSVRAGGADRGHDGHGDDKQQGARIQRNAESGCREYRRHPLVEGGAVHVDRVAERDQQPCHAFADAQLLLSALA